MKAEIENLYRVLREHGIDRTTAYLKFRRLNNALVDGVPLPANPWQSLRVSAKQFFDDVFPSRKAKKSISFGYRKIERKSMEEHFKFMLDNRLYTEKLYVEFVRNNPTECRNYYQFPWVAFKLPIKDFFDMAFPKRYHMLYLDRIKKTKMSAMDHYNLIVNLELTSAKKYRKYYLANRHKIELVSRPWDRFGLSESEFFNAIKNGATLIPKGHFEDEQCYAY